MKNFIDKLSSYNIFNYLFPGIIFVVILSKITHYNLLYENLVVSLFFYYFIGLVISRIGSVIIEPILKKISFVTFADYKDFVSVSKKDAKLDLLSEVNNTYRTLCSLMFVLLLIKIYEKISIKIGVSDQAGIIILLICLLILFLFSYKKQTEYITKRIESNKSSLD